MGGTRGLALVAPPQGTFIMYSAGQGQVALDRLNDADPESNSVFTRTFVPLLSEGLSLPELARETRRRVNDLAATVGHNQTPAYYDEVLGDFSFGEGGGSTKPSPAPTPSPVAATPPPPPVVPAAKPEPTKLAALPPPEPPMEDEPRPRSARESCARSGGTLYCASAVLGGQQGNSYGPRNVTDGSNGSAWVEGSKGQGVGEFLVLEFDAPRSVSEIAVRNGYAKNNDIYGKNSRVRDVEIRFSNGESMETTLSDQPGEQTISLNRPVETKWVQIVIRSVYPGWKYSDTAINEVRVR